MVVKANADELNLRNIGGYSVVEDSTPLDPSDGTGGTGQITLTIGTQTSPSAFKLMGKKLDLSDAFQGLTTGTVQEVGGDGGSINITADSKMNLLAAERTLNPFTGTLSAALTYYLSSCGIMEELVIDSAIADRPIVVPGYFGNVWDFLKSLAAAEQIELSLVSNRIVARALRQRTAERKRESSIGWSLNGSDLARQVDVYVYNSVYSTSKLAYPEGGWTPEVPVFTVDAGQTKEFEIDLENVTLATIQQPVPVDFVAPNYSASSVYSVAGNDGLGIRAEQWLAQGGNLTVAIGEDTRSLVVTVTAPMETDYAPYSIAVTSGNEYSSLRIVGAGVFTEPELLSMYTTVDHSKVSNVVGATIENPFIRTRQQAFETGIWALKRWGSPRYEINVATRGINRKGEAGNYSRPSFADFNAAHEGDTFADFNTLWAGKTFAEFNEFWNETTKNDFANQAFGNISGARVFEDGRWFRIRTATITPDGVTFTAEEDTTIADFNKVWAGKTFADFNTVWQGKTFADFNAAPLITEN